MIRILRRAEHDASLKTCCSTVLLSPLSTPRLGSLASRLFAALALQLEFIDLVGGGLFFSNDRVARGAGGVVASLTI